MMVSVIKWMHGTSVSLQFLILGTELGSIYKLSTSTVITRGKQLQAYSAAEAMKLITHVFIDMVISCKSLNISRSYLQPTQNYIPNFYNMKNHLRNHFLQILLKPHWSVRAVIAVSFGPHSSDE